MAPTAGRARPARRIVRLRPGDESQVVGAAALFDHPPLRAAARAYLADPRNVFLLARSGGRAVGYLRGTSLRQVESRRRQFFVYELAVDESARRQGIGRALMERMLELCRRSGHDEAFVFTDDPENRAAHGLYRSTGGRTETRGDRMYVYRFRGGPVPPPRRTRPARRGRRA
jgi:ribosomal protein S18 acetylase RimI-like enzyme